MYYGREFAALHRHTSSCILPTVHDVVLPKIGLATLSDEMPPEVLVLWLEDSHFASACKFTPVLY